MNKPKLQTFLNFRGSYSIKDFSFWSLWPSKPIVFFKNHLKIMGTVKAAGFLIESTRFKEFRLIINPIRIEPNSNFNKCWSGSVLQPNRDPYPKPNP